MTWLLTLVAVGVVIGVIRIGRTLRSPWWALGSVSFSAVRWAT